MLRKINNNIHTWIGYNKKNSGKGWFSRFCYVRLWSRFFDACTAMSYLQLPRKAAFGVITWNCFRSNFRLSRPSAMRQRLMRPFRKTFTISNMAFLTTHTKRYSHIFNTFQFSVAVAAYTHMKIEQEWSGWFNLWEKKIQILFISIPFYRI